MQLSKLGSTSQWLPGRQSDRFVPFALDLIDEVRFSEVMMVSQNKHNNIEVQIRSQCRQEQYAAFMSYIITLESLLHTNAFSRCPTNSSD